MERRPGSAGLRSGRRRLHRVAAGLLWLCAAASLALAADSHQERRNRFAQRLFRALLAADQELATRTLADGRLPLLFFYTDDPEQAAEQLNNFALADENGEPEPIRGLSLALGTTADTSFAVWAGHLPAGIFLTQEPSAEALARIVRYGIEHHVIVYSPFEGHVERGVLGGISVEAQVRPYINGATLHASGISLKAFFLKVAKVHMP